MQDSLKLKAVQIVLESKIQLNGIGAETHLVMRKYGLKVCHRELTGEGDARAQRTVPQVKLIRSVSQLECRELTPEPPDAEGLLKVQT